MKINILGRKIEINVGTVRANLVTRRVVVRTSKNGEKAKLALLLGTSAGDGVKRKFFVRTDMLDGLRLSLGRIRKV